jgi:hypothetical protein
MTTKFTLEVGLLVRGAIRNELARARFTLPSYGGSLQFEEQQCWLGSLFLVRVDGPPSVVQRLADWAREIADDAD